MTQKSSRTFLWILSVLAVFLGGFLLAKTIGVGGQIEKELTLTINVSAAGDFVIVATPDELNLKKGESGTITITNTVSGGFDARINYTLTGLPAGSFSFSVNPVNGGQSTILTINSANLASNTAYVCNLSANDI